MMPARTIELATPLGPGRASVQRRPRAHGTLVLGHGAGGHGWPADLRAVAAAAVDAGWVVALLDQPWRVAGRGVAPSPATLDRAWQAMMDALTGGPARLPRPLVVGGRSAGARVACRTARECGAAGVLALSFPLHPPGRPERSRAEELRLPLVDGLRLHVVQGSADPFGSPAEVAAQLPDAAYVSAVPGTHSLDRSSAEVTAAALAFLQRLLGQS